MHENGAAYLIHVPGPVNGVETNAFMSGPNSVAPDVLNDPQPTQAPTSQNLQTQMMVQSNSHACITNAKSKQVSNLRKVPKLETSPGPSVLLTSGLTRRLSLLTLRPSILQSSHAADRWIVENAHSVGDGVKGFTGFDSDVLDRKLLSCFLYPRLLVYVISCAHAKTPSLVSKIKKKENEWAAMSILNQLSMYRAIQDTLWGFLIQCNDYTIEMRKEAEQVAKNDAFCISAHVISLLGDHDRIKTFKAKHPYYLQNYLDLLQMLADCPEAVTCRPLLLRITYDLSRGSSLYPNSLNLCGVERTTELLIGSGASGDVYAGKVGNIAVAIKVMRHIRSETLEHVTKAYVQEALLWKQLRHPHVLPFYGLSWQPWLQDTNSGVITLISPLMPNGNIVEYTADLPISDRLSLLADAASGLEYLHTLNPPMIHGDLKATNILVTEQGRACLADFGLCTLVEAPDFVYTPTASTNASGAWPYRSPELLLEPNEGGTRRTIESDMYAFGCVCYELCVTKAARFSHLPLLQRYLGVMNNWRLVQPTSMSSRLWNIVESCWEIRTSARPLIGQVVKTLREELPAGLTETEPTPWDLRIMTYLRNPKVISPLLDIPDFELDTQSIVITEKDVVIALMGPTGTGKSSFINVALQREAAEVSDTLESCTQEVCAFACSHPDRSGRRIILVDTPGFDDIYKTDWDILTTISDWLAKSYRRKITLSGILQFHAIDQRRMGCAPSRNLAMFEDLCGADAMKHVVLISTHWDLVSGPTGIQREDQLMTQFWQNMIQKGSRVERFSPRTYHRAWEIIDMFPCVRTAPLTVQKEMVDEGKELSETSAFQRLKGFWGSIKLKLRKPNRQNKREKRSRANGEQRSRANGAEV